MLSFLNLIKLLIGNINLLVFFIVMFITFGILTKDFKSSLKVILTIVLALSLAHLI
ncbi:hypothetical protein N2W53_003154 [Clostridium perfringens]|nr:hypothetical protein [Clostridium perfringens]EJT6543201.1 hypothetical protein [Clostridium perfringens]EJT6568222.1 hypothetical protein [Clostridium perfringens]MBS5996117.1 hypothetical protein [Clostridium perfringens]MDU5659404.1 hypothetical protein [Clostridium perfringens]